jgi:RND superfamily putative drug exporter
LETRLTTTASDLDGLSTATLRGRERAASATRSGEYSERLGALARFTVRHKALVIGDWIAVAAVLALLFRAM